MENMFSLVLTTSLYASVVGVVIILLKTVLKNKINAFWHYAVWTVLLLKLLIPFGPESAVSLFNTVPVHLVHNESANNTYKTEQGNTAAEIAGKLTVNELARTEAEPVTTAEASFESIIPYIWFSGAFLILLVLLLSNYSLCRKLRKNTLMADERVNGIFQECKNKMNIRKDIEVVFQDIVGTPSLFGIIRPKILLTPAVSNLSVKELEYILLHELAHYKRKDMFINYILLGLQAVHWFNPVMWYCFMRIREDMETATDEKVLSIINSTEHKDYGKALLAVLESFDCPKLAPKLLGMVDDKKNIERRIKMIKMSDFFKRKRTVIMIIGVLCIAILCGISLTNAVSKQTPCKIGNYTLEVPSDWKVNSIMAPDDSVAELTFKKGGNLIGGVQIVSYEPGQPLPLPNHSVTKSKKNIDGLLTEAVLINLDMSQPAASGDTSIENENHLYLIFKDDKVAYEIYANTKYVDAKELIKIAKSFKLENSKSIAVKNDLVYKNDKYGFSFTLPESWKGKYVIKDNGYTVSVHNKTLSESSPDGYFGTLFTIHIYSKDKWKTEGVALADATGMRKITEDDNAIFAVRMPTDVQCTFDKADEYHSMEKDIDSIIKTFAVKRSSDSSSKTIINFLGYTGLKSDSIQKIRLELFDGSDLKSLINDKAAIAGLLEQLNSMKLLPCLNENTSKDMTNGIYITLNNGDKNSYFYIDYATGGLAEYAPFMSPLPKFEYRFEDTKKLKKVIDEYISKLPGNPQTLEQAVSQAVLKRSSSYLEGEAAAEGHIILDTEEKNGKIKVYTVSSFGWFGFENGVFTSVGGCGAIPTVITFSKGQNGVYSLLEYKEPVDGAGNVKSKKEMFPKRLWDKVLSGDKYYSELVKQKEAQAAEYLKSIGRNAKVSQKYVERKLPKINVEASNKLFAEFTKSNPEVNKFPYWLGTREQLENGVRYIYETSQSKTDDGHDLIVFKKTKQDGTLIKEYKYKIVGSEPVQIN